MRPISPRTRRAGALRRIFSLGFSVATGAPRRAQHGRSNDELSNFRPGSKAEADARSTTCVAQEGRLRQQRRQQRHQGRGGGRGRGGRGRRRCRNRCRDRCRRRSSPDAPTTKHGHFESSREACDGRAGEQSGPPGPMAGLPAMLWRTPPCRCLSMMSCMRRRTTRRDKDNLGMGTCSQHVSEDILSDVCNCCTATRAWIA